MGTSGTRFMRVTVGSGQRKRGFFASMGVLSSMAWVLSGSAVPALNAQTTPTVSAVMPTNTTEVARVTGVTQPGETLPNGQPLPNPNQTFPTYNLDYTDIGTMWETQNHEMMFAFGDNFTTLYVDPQGGRHYSGWRSNGLALSSDTTLNGGLHFSTILTDGGMVKQLIAPVYQQVTAIPTGGVNVGSRQYINYMAMHQWALNGDYDNWVLDYSALAYSDDYGNTWTTTAGQVQWDGGTDPTIATKFAEVAYLKSGAIVYVFGTPAGRHGKTYLAKVNADKMLDKTAYQYWAGTAWVQGNETAAQPITQTGTGEMSVIYSPYYHRYFMAYLDVKRRAIVFRDAADPTGDWSEEKVLAEENGYDIYAPMLHPWFANGTDLYYFVSHASPSYAIFLYHSTLVPTDFNMVSDPGFEEFPNDFSGPKSQWKIVGAYRTSDAHGGVSAGEVDNSGSGWIEGATQSVAVTPNTDYVLTAWVKVGLTTPNKAYFGVRGSQIGIQDRPVNLNTTDWTQMSRTFNSGSDTSVQVFFGSWGDTGMTYKIDDVTLVPANLIVDPGFENVADSRSHWVNPAVYRTSDAHSGRSAGMVNNSNQGTWIDAATQTVAVKPNTNYVLTAWVKVGLTNTTNAYFGVRGSQTGIQDQPVYSATTGWTQMSRSFNSGADTSLLVFFGSHGAPGMSYNFDDVKLEPAP